MSNNIEILTAYKFEGKLYTEEDLSKLINDRLGIFCDEISKKIYIPREEVIKLYHYLNNNKNELINILENINEFEEIREG